MRNEEFEALFTEHADGLFSFLAYRTGDRTLAEDLLGDAFERALRARKRFNPRKGTPKAWIYAIALNALRDHVRRTAAESRALDRLASGAPEHADPLGGGPLEARDSVMRAVATLSADEREAVALRFGADLTVPEMAALLDEPLTTMEGRTYRALRKLRAELEAPTAPGTS